MSLYCFRHDEQIKHYQERIKELEEAHQKVNLGFQTGDGRIAKPMRGGTTELEK